MAREGGEKAKWGDYDAIAIGIHVIQLGLDIRNLSMQLLELKNLGESIDGAIQDGRFAIVLLAHNLGVHLCAHTRSESQRACYRAQRTQARARQLSLNTQVINTFGRDAQSPPSVLRCQDRKRTAGDCTEVRKREETADVTSQKIPTRKLMRKIPDANMKRQIQTGPNVRLDSYMESQS